MLVADDLRLGEWRGRRPLIYPALLRSVLFAIVFVGFDVLEKMLIGVIRGKAADSIEAFGGGGFLGAIIVAIIIAIGLVPFFAFVEVAAA